MWRYRLPGHEPHLLAQLQKQQNSNIFCDTLLQTEGVSVPAHSCILAALSPYLFQKLSASGSPSAGSRHQLQLQTVTAKTLLKVVGLLYSGELNVEGAKDKEELLSAARHFGLGCLEEEWRDNRKEGEAQEEQQQQQSCKGCREARIQNEAQKKREKSKRNDAEMGMDGRIEGENRIGRKTFVDAGTQTVQADGEMVDPVASTPPPPKLPVPAPTLPRSYSKGSLCLNPGKSTPRQLPSPSISHSTCAVSGKSNSVHSEPCLETVNESFTTDEVREPGETCGAPGDDLNHASFQVVCVRPQVSYYGKNAEKLISSVDGNETDSTLAGKGNRDEEQLCSRAEALTEERMRTGEKRGANGTVGMKSLARMEQMKSTTATQVPKLKLRKRMRGERWEVVGVQGTDSMPTSADCHHGLTVLKKGGAEGVRHQGNCILVPSSSPPLFQTQTHLTLTPPPVFPSSSTCGALHINPTSDLHKSSCDFHTPNPHTNSQATLLPQPQGPVEELDEQIEKLLEDIMIGLNILPSVNLEGDCIRQQHLHEALPVGISTALGPANCVRYPEYGTGSDFASSADPGIQCSSMAQGQASCSFAVHQISNRVQCHQYSAHQCLSSLTYPREGHISTSQGTALPETPCHAEARSVIPIILDRSDQNSCGQQVHHLQCQDTRLHLSEPSSQSPRNNTQSSTPHYLICREELSLPKCLSPLTPPSSVADYQTAFNNITNNRERDMQPHLKGPPWLTRNVGIIQFPLRLMVQQQETPNHLPQSNQRQVHQSYSHRLAHMDGHGESSTSGFHKQNEVRKELNGIVVTSQNVPALNLKCEGVKEKTKRKREQHDLPRDNMPVAKKTRNLQSCTKNDLHQTQSKISVDAVGLSSNKVLAEDKKLSRNMPLRYAAEPKDFSANNSVKCPLAPETQRLEVQKACKSHIKTRSSSNRSKRQKIPKDSCPETTSALGTLAKIMGNADKVEQPKRKVGRPRKIKPEDSFPPNCTVPSTDERNGGKRIKKMDEGGKGSQDSEEKNDKQNQSYMKGVGCADTGAEIIVSSVIENPQNSGQTLSLRRVSVFQPNGEKKQTPGSSSFTETAADKDAAEIADNKLRLSKQMPRVMLKKFQELIKTRCLKSKNANENGESGISQAEKNDAMTTSDLTCGETYSSSEELAKEMEINKDTNQGQNDGAFRTSDVTLLTENGPDKDQSKESKEVEDKQRKNKNRGVTQSRDQGNNVLPDDAHSKGEACEKISTMTEIMEKALPVDGSSSPIMLSKMCDPQMTVRHENVKAMRMEAKPSEVGLQEVHPSVIGRKAADLAICNEILNAVENHPISSSTAVETLSGNNEDKDKTDEGEAGVGIKEMNEEEAQVINVEIDKEEAGVISEEIDEETEMINVEIDKDTGVINEEIDEEETQMINEEIEEEQTEMINVEIDKEAQMINEDIEEEETEMIHVESDEDTEMINVESDEETEMINEEIDKEAEVINEKIDKDAEVINRKIDKEAEVINVEINNKDKTGVINVEIVKEETKRINMPIVKEETATIDGGMIDGEMIDGRMIDEEIDVEEAEMIDVENDEEEHLNYQTKAVEVSITPNSTAESAPGKFAAAINDHIHLANKNTVASFSSLKKPEDMHSGLMDSHTVTTVTTGTVTTVTTGICKQEEDEVDILSCSPSRNLQSTDWSKVFPLIELSSEEEDEEEADEEETNEIDVTS